MKDSYNVILDYINTLEIIDTHEHLPSNEEDRDRETDILKEYLSHYFCRDLISSGLSVDDYNKIMEEDMPLMKKWEMVEPFWELSRYTGYGRSLDIVAKDIYGIEKIDGTTIGELNDKFKKTLKTGHFKKILKDKCKIITSLLTVDTLSKKYNPTRERSICCNRDLYSPVYSVSCIIQPRFWSDVEKIERESDIRITSFSSYLEATEILIDKAYSMGSVALKNYLAYQRTLNYERVIKSKAEEDFNNIFRTSHLPKWDERQLITGKAFQDYMFHYILDISNRKNLIIQIHTGIQEGSGNKLSNSNPTLLSNLFLEYPDVTFDIFHISYPYQNELAVLTKNFANVFIDMCWAHIISPNASINALLEFLDTVPLNKISAFGGDYLFVDGVYGHLKIARQVVSKALSVKVKEGLFDVDKAKEVARMLFYDNPKNIFRL
ncbi:Uronate isomerase [subsurface metagenome]|nr:amidohydrolase family protein [Clostridia bacterium]